MSSNMRLKKVCQHCNQSFVAKQFRTKFCSDNCTKRNHKKRVRDEKITIAILETNTQVLDLEKSTDTQGKVQVKLPKEWISIHELSDLLGVTERTLFRLIKQSEFPKVKIGRRLLFNKQQVLDYVISKSERI